MLDGCVPCTILVLSESCMLCVYCLPFKNGRSSTREKGSTGSFGVRLIDIHLMPDAVVTATTATLFINYVEPGDVISSKMKREGKR